MGRGARYTWQKNELVILEGPSDEKTNSVDKSEDINEEEDDEES